MARRVEIQIVGDASSLERSFKHASASAKTFNREVTGSVRGVLSVSGAFDHLGRSIAFASGGFVAFASAGEFIRKSVDAARDAAVAQRSLAAQVKAAGQSFKASKAAIDNAGLSLEKFGFTTEDSAKALTVLERGTGNIAKAIRLQAVTANLARAKNIALADAASVVAKVFGRQETALRRAVPGLSKTAHGMDLIREASQKLAGQARANTTESERFNATLHDSQVIIGDALLPVINHYLESLGKWLQKMNESGRLQRDVNHVVKDAQGVFAAAKAVVLPLADAFKELSKEVGGTANALKVLAGAFAAFKFAKFTEGIAGVGGAATTSAGEVRGLRAALVSLSRLGAIALTVDLILNKKQVDDFLKSHGLGFLTQSGASLLTGGGSRGPLGLPFSKDPSDTRPDTSGRVPPIHFNFPGGPSGSSGSSGGGTSGGRGFGFPAFSTNFTAPKSAPLSARQQFQIALLANPDSISLLQQNAAHDRAALAFAEKLRARGTISNAKYLQEVTGYQNDLNSTLGQIAALNAAAAAKTAEQRRKAAEALKKEQEAAKKHREALAKAAAKAALEQAGETGGSRLAGRAALNLFTGLAHLNLGGRPGSFTVPEGIQLAEARATATGDQAGFVAALKRAKAAAQRALKSGRLSLAAQIDAWNAITDANNQLTRDNSSFGPTGRVASSQALTSGIKFASVAARRQQEARLAQALAHGVSVKPLVIHNHVHLDGKEVARSTTKHQTVAGRHRAVQTSGIHAGRPGP